MVYKHTCNYLQFYICCMLSSIILTILQLKRIPAHLIKRDLHFTSSWVSQRHIKSLCIQTASLPIEIVLFSSIREHQMSSRWNWTSGRRISGMCDTNIWVTRPTWLAVKYWKFSCTYELPHKKQEFISIQLITLRQLKYSCLSNFHYQPGDVFNSGLVCYDTVLQIWQVWIS